MSADEQDQTSSENSGDEEQTSSEEKGGDEEQTSSETPELSEEGKEKVRQMREAYDDDRTTAVLPGTDNTITGVAVNKWLDDDGNPKFGKDEQQDDDKQHHDDKQHEDHDHTEGDKQREDQNDSENA